MSHSDGCAGATTPGTLSSRSNGRAHVCEAHLGFSVFPHLTSQPVPVPCVDFVAPLRGRADPCRDFVAPQAPKGVKGGHGWTSP